MASSLDHNPPNADRHITSGGSDWLWAVFAVMAISDLIMVFWTFRRPRGTRLFHQVAVIVLTTATIAYYSMASDLGATPVTAQFQRGGAGTRQVWFVRYIQWFITLPLLLLELLLATGLSLSDIFTTMFMAWVFVVCGLVGSLVVSSYKWGYFVLGCMALFYIWYMLLGHGPRSTFAAGGVVRSGYVRSSAYLSFLLLLYPISWGLSEGGNVISPTGEMIFYGILDLLAGPVFLFLFLFGLRSIEYGAFGLSSGKHHDGYGNGYNNGANGVNGANGANMATRGGAPLGAAANTTGSGIPGVGVGAGHTGAGAGVGQNAAGAGLGHPGPVGANVV
ncbi:family A G protein-coupled receptor-like protein [Trametes versicolor FP-101664 SS1]|uniref:family A G protein-coupled receptor-like protein n=1 Tax=Trametes versicolor (strain FP-101664) TaxID=717944 RepID=UPI0004621524|nr:family A G protein-coupled receptor-like protein [Trametes versicolor FP-101664 SS1]EIW60452.1 family A G protein-coupled receptor-like protein [Trametes versicolor FP-101664 SS1]